MIENATLSVSSLRGKLPSGANLPTVQESPLKREEDSRLPQIWIRSHYANFNGLRALAVFLVFLFHAGWLVLGGASQGLWIGVDLFFVLSGFLITGILYDSLDDPKYFRNFYIRRGLRILPLFYTFFLALFIATPFLHLRYSPLLLSYFAYAGNIVVPFCDVDHNNPTIVLLKLHGRTFRITIAHLWSLCLEEQFYLVWPWIVWKVKARRKLMRLCLLSCFLIPALRLTLFLLSYFRTLNWEFFYLSPFTRSDTLLWGAWLALWLRERPLSRSKLRSFSALLFAIPTALIVLSGILLPDHQHYNRVSMFMRTIGYSLIALSSLGLILYSLDEKTFLSRVLQLRWVAWFGSISYGFYFIHFLVLGVLQDMLGFGILPQRLSWTLPVITFLATLALAALSFRYIESPFLKLKSRWAPQGIPKGKGSGAEYRSLHVAEPQPMQ